MSILITIEVILLFIIIIIGSIVIYYVVNNQSELNEKIKKDGIYSNNYEDQYVINARLDSKINNLEKQVKPLIKERNDKLIAETWKQFNEWKYKIQTKSELIDEPVCGKCLCDTLEIEIEYKNKNLWINPPNKYGMARLGGVDYPISAKWKCSTCGHIAKSWKYKEED